jgi:hypothetical protein
MNEVTEKCGKKVAVLLAASLGLNIFFLAFSLGHGLTPHPHPDEVGLLPPPPPFAMNKPGSGVPFFGPQALFTADEMRSQEDMMRERFDKVAGLRKAFAEKLAAGAVSRDDALAHFADIDQVMDSVRKEAQGKAADKISQMSDEERKQFAQNLAQNEGRMMRGQGRMGGRGMGGQGMGGPGMGFGGGQGRGGLGMNAPLTPPDAAAPSAPPQPQAEPAAAQPAGEPTAR